MLAVEDARTDDRTAHAAAPVPHVRAEVRLPSVGIRDVECPAEGALPPAIGVDLVPPPAGPDLGRQPVNLARRLLHRRGDLARECLPRPRKMREAGLEDRVAQHAPSVDIDLEDAEPGDRPAGGRDLRGIRERTDEPARPRRRQPALAGRRVGFRRGRHRQPCRRKNGKRCQKSRHGTTLTHR